MRRLPLGRRIGALLVAATVALAGAAAAHGAQPNHPLPTLVKVEETPFALGKACPEGTLGLWQVRRNGKVLMQCTYRPAKRFFDEKVDYWQRRNGARPVDPKLPVLTHGPPWVVTVNGQVVYSGGEEKARTVFDRRLVAYQLDSYLERKFPLSPLIGKGAVFVREARAQQVDPRVEVAIAVCETSAGTKGPGPAVHNPFGIFTAGSKNREFSNWEKSISYLSVLLRRSYLNQGLRTIAEIGSKYAPVGAGNDPRNLNSNWIVCVTAVYGSGLGGTRYLPNELSPWQEEQAIRRQISQLWQDISRRPELGHYTQRRPVPTRDLSVEYATEHDWWGDCSGTLVWIYYRAGLPLPPSGWYSWTGSMQGQYTKVATPAIGDAVLYNGHVTVVLGFRGNDPTADRHDIFVGSHGSESGPYGFPKEELTADYRKDFVGFYRPPGLS